MTKISSKLFNRIMSEIGLVAMALAFVVVPAISNADTLSRQLEFGMSGTDVSAVQSFLAKDPTLYSQGFVTGFFGSMTKVAVANFQTRNNIPAVGRIGPMTLPVLNLQMQGDYIIGVGDSNADGSQTAPIISSLAVNVGKNGATVNWLTNELAKGIVYYSTSPLVASESADAVAVSGNTEMSDSNYHSAQNVSLTALEANTTYYYLVYTIDQHGNVTVTWPSTFRTSN